MGNSPTKGDYDEEDEDRISWRDEKKSSLAMKKQRRLNIKVRTRPILPAALTHTDSNDASDGPRGLDKGGRWAFGSREDRYWRFLQTVKARYMTQDAAHRRYREVAALRMYERISKVFGRQGKR
jgi:hypothetical protein